MRHTNAILTGGWCLIVFAILYVGITILIDNMVQNQPLLYGLESHELFKVMAGTQAIRTLLSIYAVLPALLIPGAVGAYYCFIDHHEANMRMGMYFATLGAAALALSLMMIPSINWHLATYIQALPASEQPSMIIVLKAMHSYFGIYVGDILGLGSLLIWFFICSFVMLRSDVMPHIVGVIELIIAFIALLVLCLRYSGLIPGIQGNIQVNAIIALWVFIFGIALVSLRTR